MTEKVCTICFGREVVELEQTHYGIPITEPCRCAIARDIRRNLTRGWVGIPEAKKLKSSVLEGHENEDLYITATDATLRSHLRYIGVKKGRNWSFQVVSDLDLMSAWLATKKFEGAEIFDVDVKEAYDREGIRPGRLGKMTLEDLVEPAGLLVIRLGVKRSRNSAMPEVFLEALTLRDHINRPTWIVDRPGLGRFNCREEDHRCYSPEAEGILVTWPYFELDKVDTEYQPSGLEELFQTQTSESEPETGGEAPAVEHSQPRLGATSLSGASGARKGGARSVAAPEPPKDKGRWKK